MISGGKDSSEQSADEVSDSDVSAEEQERPRGRGRRQSQRRPAMGKGRERGDSAPGPEAIPAPRSRRISLHRAEHPDNEALKRPQKFAIAEYREELVRVLAGLKKCGQPPVFKPPTKEPGEFVTVHIPKFTDIKKNLKFVIKQPRTK